jgi:hypothetical protein
MTPLPRRKFLSMLAALPIVGPLLAKAEPAVGTGLSWRIERVSPSIPREVYGWRTAKDANGWYKESTFPFGPIPADVLADVKARIAAGEELTLLRRPVPDERQKVPPEWAEMRCDGEHADALFCALRTDDGHLLLECHSGDKDMEVDFWSLHESDGVAFFESRQRVAPQNHPLFADPFSSHPHTIFIPGGDNP